MTFFTETISDAVSTTNTAPGLFRQYAVSAEKSGSNHDDSVELGACAELDYDGR
jgi:hypothetical protein